MSAADQMRAMLDELMGTNRDDCDRRVEVAKAKLSETQEELSEEAQSISDVINQLGEKIGTTLAKAEELGAQGEVDGSLTMMQELEEMNAEKSKCEAELKAMLPVSTYQQQKLRVCEACSAYLGIHDNDRRLADHFGGKLHVGFITIRHKLDELRKFVDKHDLVRKRREQLLREGVRRDVDRSSYERSRDRDRDSNITSSVSYRDRSRDRDRDHKRRRRSRSRSHSRSKSRRKEKKHKKRKSRSRDRSSDRR